MKTCLHCRADNVVANKFCQQCGRPFDAGPPIDATVRWKGGALADARVPRRTIAVGSLFGQKTRLVIGRAPDCDVCLPHPMVSRYHALLELLPLTSASLPRGVEGDTGLRLRDLGSVNGVVVDGRRIRETVLLHEGTRVGIGPFLFTLCNGVIHSVDSSRSLRLEARGLEKTVLLADGKQRKLLDGVNLVVNPGEFVSLLGPSGSGKSTLMDCLNGRRRATGGAVLANGEDFYRNFDNFRQSLGYVPQKDIVHTQLTVYRALYYTTRLRLPTDTEPAELSARIEEVVRLMELGPHRDTLVADLSGGQIKRVSLGAELLAQPSLLFIDEATSGLDAGTEARMMRLFRSLADEGRSIVCITHNVDNVDQCHLILVLARGRLVFFGPPAAAPDYFKVKRVSDIYDRLAGRDLADWVHDYEASDLHREYVTDRQEPESAARAEGPGTVVLGLSKRRIPLAESWHQFKALTSRYVELITGDRRGLRLLLLQAPIVGLFLLMGFLDRNFVSTMPFPRPLKDSERRMIAAFQKMTEFDVDNFIDDPTPAQRKALEKIVFDIRPPDEITGAQLVRILRRLPPGAEPETLLKHSTLEVERDGAMVAVSGVPLVLLAHQVDAKLPKNITEAEAWKTLRNLRNLDENADEVKRLRKAKLRFDRAGKPHKMNAAEVLTLLNALEGEGDSPLRRGLEEAKVTFELDRKPVEFTADDLRKVHEQMRASTIPMNLLKFNGPVVPEKEGINPRYTYMLLFIVVMIVLWFGCNNAAKEIVKEEAIYARERSVNLGIVPYLASKFVVQSVVTAFHSALLMAVVFGPLELLHRTNPATFSAPHPHHILNYPALFGMLVLLSMTGAALGLLISSCVATPDRANALLPYVLIPQIVLGGGFLDVTTGLLHTMAQGLSPVYWAYRAAHLNANELPQGFPGRVPYHDDVARPCAALLIQCAALLVLTWWFLRRKDV